MAGRTCPICEAPAARPGSVGFPFCSERCRLIDLGNWLGESYRVAPSEDDESGEGETADDPAA